MKSVNPEESGAIPAGDELTTFRVSFKEGLTKFKKGDMEGALRSFEVALTGFERYGRAQEIAATLINISTIFYTWGDSAKAYDHGVRALDLARSVNAIREEADALGNVGLFVRALGKQDGIMYFRQALEKYRSLGDSHGTARQLGNLGLAYLSTGDHLNAAQHLTDSLDAFESIHDVEGACRVMGVLGETFLRSGELDRALQTYQTHYNLLRANDGSPRDIANTLRCLSTIHHIQGESEKALKLCHKAYRISSKSKDKIGQALALKSTASLLSREGEQDQARGYYKKALSLYQQIDDAEGQAGILMSMGHVALVRGEAKDAEAYLGESRDIYHETDDLCAEAEAILGLAQAQLELAKPSPSIFSYRAFRALLKDDFSPDARAAFEAGLGEIDLYRGRTRLAVKRFERAIHGYRETDQHEGEAVLLGLLGNALRVLGDFDTAWQKISSSAAFFHSEGDLPGEADVQVLMSTLLRDRGMVRESREAADQALKIYRRFGLKAGELACLLVLGQLAADEGAPDLAQRDLTRAKEGFESLGLLQGSCDADIALHEIAISRGEAADRAEHIKETIASCEEIGYLPGLSRAHRVLGLYHMEHGTPGAALAEFQAARDLQQRIENDGEIRDLEGLLETRTG